MSAADGECRCCECGAAVTLTEYDADAGVTWAYCRPCDFWTEYPDLPGAA